MSFCISGLDPTPFRHLYGLSETELNRHGAIRYAVDGPGFPDRIELREGVVGETMMLLNFEHQPAPTPYHASHAIFVREGASEAYRRIDEIPDVFTSRLMSLRAFDTRHFMVTADAIDGTQTRAAIEAMFADGRVDYIHAHYAKRGCFAARIDRV